MKDPYVTVRAVQPVLAGLEILGYDNDALLAAGGIDGAVFLDPDGLVPHSTMKAVWDRALSLRGDDSLGIHVAEAAPIRSFEVHAYAFLSSPTPRDAYHRASRYQRLIHEVNELVFEERTEVGVLRHAQPGGRAVSRHVAEFLATLWVRFGRLLTGEDWSPTLVAFAHRAPSDTTEHARVFRSRLRFSSASLEMHIPNRVLDLPNPRGNEGLLSVLDRYADGIMKQLPRAVTLSDRVRSRLLEELKDGAPTADKIAQAFRMSVRTLHRGLKSEGTSFRELLDQLRHEQAVALLSDDRASIAEVGFLLGFSELSSFYRAFKRWTGKTPTAFRAGARGSATAPRPPGR